MKKTILISVLIWFCMTSYSQKKPLVVVDGYFIKSNKIDAIKFLGFENIKDTVYIRPDSAIKIVSEHGVNGLFLINTIDKKSKKSQKIIKNLYFNNLPRIYINNYSKSYQDLTNLDPKLIDSINIIPPLTTAIHSNTPNDYGGVISIVTKDNPDKIIITELTNLKLASDTTFTLVDNYIKLPSFEIELDLSDKAEKKLRKTKETIIVRAMFRGTPKDKDNEEFKEWGEIYLGDHKIELESERIAEFSNAKVLKEKFDQLEDINFEILINVYSGRRSNAYNILDVNILQKPVMYIKGKKFTLRGGLNGE